MNILILLFYLIVPLVMIFGTFYLFRIYKEKLLDREPTGKFSDIRAEEVQD